jgi:hypothetical protein
MKMTEKFKVYAQTRATRQLAGDVAQSIKVDYSDPTNQALRKEKAAWQEVERLLNAVECKLERMCLK